jgi:hypothetical protein
LGLTLDVHQQGLIAGQAQPAPAAEANHDQWEEARGQSSRSRRPLPSGRTPGRLSPPL